MSIPKVGEVLDNYLILEAKIPGDFAYVFKVQNQEDSEEFALKLSKQLCQEDIERFQNENDILQSLKGHKNIITAHSLVITNPASHMYYVMELANSHLDGYIGSSRDTISNIEKVRIFREICEGLQHSHRNGVVHRDLHWGNVLMIRNSDVKISDFGMAKQFGVNQINLSNKPNWGGFVRPPEFNFNLWNLTTPIEHQVVGDIYALGIILYYLFDIAPLSYVYEIQPNIINFIKRENLDFSQLTQEQKQTAYEKWLSILNLYYNLDIFLPIDSENTRINAIIKKATNPDFSLRYQTIDELLHDVDNIFI